jgi:hypothetical protein
MTSITPLTTERRPAAKRSRALLFSGAALLSLASLTALPAQAQVLLSEGFDNMAALPGLGWSLQNNSTEPISDPGWYQSDGSNFPAQSGAASSYAANDFLSTQGEEGTEIISDWLITPTLNLQNGDTITFYTRTLTGSIFPDRLQLRLSTNGTSTNVGTTETSVGDFTTLLADVNPSLLEGGYPETWTPITVSLSGFSSPFSGRFAFRYFVTDAGPFGTNSNFIGVDTVSVVRPIAPATAPEPGTLALVGMAGLPLIGLVARRRC